MILKQEEEKKKQEKPNMKENKQIVARKMRDKRKEEN